MVPKKAEMPVDALRSILQMNPDEHESEGMSDPEYFRFSGMRAASNSALTFGGIDFIFEAVLLRFGTDKRILNMNISLCEETGT